MATVSVKDSKDGMERRVYVLPTELLQRLRAYQAENGIASEVEAARRLLDSALQMRDNVETILQKLALKMKEEPDIRILARDVLVTHVLVESIEILDNAMAFKLKGGWKGLINSLGELYIGKPDEDSMRLYHPAGAKSKQLPTRSPEKPPSREPAKGYEIDDEIPF